MLKETKRTLELFKRINESELVKDTLPSNKFDEHNKNLEDLKCLLMEYNQLIDFLEKRPLNKENINEVLVKIHMKIIALIWHLEQLDELLIDLLKNIPE